MLMRRFSHRVGRFILVTREYGLSEAIRLARKVLAKPSRPVFQSLTTIPMPISNIESDIRVSVLMPVFNTPSRILDEAIMSVIGQTYPNWELCICDDASTSKETVQALERYRGIDPRIKIVRAPENLHIARATNLAAEFATGHFVAFLDHDDTLELDAIRWIVNAVHEKPDADVIYTDEDKIEVDGRRSEPYLKPDWSPEHLQSVMYILHLLVVRKALFWQLGGLRHEYTGAQDYDLVLRATARARRVVHVPRVLYHWRKVPGSAAEVVDAKPTALVNAQRALQDFVAKIEPNARVDVGLFTGSFRVRWPVDTSRPVTLLILTGSRTREVEGRGSILLVSNMVESIVRQSTFPNYQILIVDDGRMPGADRERLESVGARVEQYRFEGEFNFSDKANFSLKFVETEDVIILNDDLEVISPDWIEALLEHSRRQDVG